MTLQFWGEQSRTSAQRFSLSVLSALLVIWWLLGEHGVLHVTCGSDGYVWIYLLQWLGTDEREAREVDENSRGVEGNRYRKGDVGK